MAIFLLIFFTVIGVLVLLNYLNVPYNKTASFIMVLLTPILIGYSIYYYRHGRVGTIGPQYIPIKRYPIISRLFFVFWNIFYVILFVYSLHYLFS